MPDVGEVRYAVKLDNSNLDHDAQDTGGRIQSALDQITGKLDKSLGYQVLKDIGGAFVEMGKQAVSAFVDITKSAVDSVASLEQNIGGVETLFQSSSDTVIANAERAYQTAGLSANEYMETVTGFSASLLQSLGGDTEEAAKVADMAVTDMSDNANKMGSDMASIQAAYQGFAKQNYTMLDNLKLGYGGTKSEMERLIADANRVKEANGEMGDLSIESFADVTEAIHIMQTEIGITGTTALEASTTIEGSLNATRAAWDNLLNGSGTAEEFAETAWTYIDNLVTNLEEIIPRIAEMIPEIVGVLAEHAPELFEAVGTILDSLWSAMQEAAPALLEIVGTLLGDVISRIIEGAPEMVSTVLDLVSKGIEALSSGQPAFLEKGLQLVVSIITGIVQALPQLTQQIIALVGSILVTIVNSLPQIINSGMDIIDALVNGFLEAGPGIILTIGQLLTQLLTAIMQNAPQMLQRGIELINSLVNGLIQNGPAIISAILTVLSGLFQTIIQNAPQMLQQGIVLLSNLAAGLIQAIPQLIAALPGIINSIFNYFNNTNWWVLGWNLLVGIANGIVQGAFNIVNALIGAVQNAWNSALSWLGIHSPSTRARDEIGKRIPQGAAEGIEDDSDLVTDAMVDTYKTAFDVAEQFTSDISYNMPGLSDYAADVGASISYQNEQTVIVPVTLDGREIARVTAPFMGEQLAWES